MAQPVTGYLTSDGTFYETESAALAYEHEQRIRALCESHKVDFDKFMNLVEIMWDDIKGYMNVTEKDSQPSAAIVDSNISDLGGAEGLSEALQQQPPSGPEHLPHIRHRKKR